MNRGELGTVTYWTAGTTTYTYDAAGRMTGVAAPNGVTTTTDLTTWTAKATASQRIGVPVSNTTSNFGITRLASGTWLLGWLGLTAVDEGLAQAALPAAAVTLVARLAGQDPATLTTAGVWQAVAR